MLTIDSNQLNASIVLLITLLTLTACTQKEPRLYQQQIFALGTLVDVSLYNVDPDTARQAISAVTTTLEQIHHDWHPWQAGRLTTINQKLSQGESVTLSPAEQKLIAAGIELSRQSDALFNPAIGKLIALWGFHQDERPDLPPPSALEIDAVLAQQSGMESLVLQGDQLSSRNPALQLDVGAYAKGYAVDLAIAELRRLGIKNAIVNAGGDLRAIGSKGKRPWRIGIRAPRGPGVIASLEIHEDESIFTSGDYERYFDYQGVRYHHILDPRSGQPAQGATSVTVIHPVAASADAAATALIIAGPKRWQAVAAAMGISAVMLIDSQGVVHLSPSMAERIWFEADPKPEIVVHTAAP